MFPTVGIEHKPLSIDPSTAYLNFVATSALERNGTYLRLRPGRTPRPTFMHKLPRVALWPFSSFLEQVGVCAGALQSQ